MSILMPKKVKHRKWMKGTSRGIEVRGTELSFGSYGLKSLETQRITARQIEAGRRAILRYLKKGGKLWVRIFPDKPITTKGTEVPMGGGKGAPDQFVAVIKPGTVLFEMEGVSIDKAKEAMRLAGHKIPVKSKFVIKE